MHWNAGSVIWITDPDPAAQCIRILCPGSIVKISGGADPDPYVFGPPGPASRFVSHKYGSESGSGSLLTRDTWRMTLHGPGRAAQRVSGHHEPRICLSGHHLVSIRLPVFLAVLRIYRIHTFLGLLDPDPLVRGMDPDPALDPDPDPSIIMQK